MQKRFPGTWNTSRTMAIVRRIMLFEHALHLLIGVPAEIGGVCILDADVPFLR